MELDEGESGSGVAESRRNLIRGIGAAVGAAMLAPGWPWRNSWRRRAS